MAQSARERMREAAKRRSQESTHAGGGGFSVRLPDGVEFFKNDGKTVDFDFVPYEISDKRNIDVLAGRLKVGDLVDSRAYWVHNNIGPDQTRVICLKTIGKPCPICEGIVDMKRNPNIDPKDIDDIKAKERVLYNVIDVNEKKAPVRVWDVSYHLFTKQLEKEQRDKEERYDFATLDAGSTLHLRFEKKKFGKGEPFYDTDRIDFEKREPYDDDILKEVVDLDAALNIMTYEQLQKLFLGVDSDPEPEPEKEKAPEKEERGGRGERSRREPEPEKEEKTERGSRSRRDAEPDPEPEKEERTHRRDPDAEGERKRGEDEYKNELEECPGKTAKGKAGVFGEDTDKLEHCDKGKGCEKWDDCREEKDRRAKDVKGGGRKAKDPEPEPEKEERGTRSRRR